MEITFLLLSWLKGVYVSVEDLKAALCGGGEREERHTLEGGEHVFDQLLILSGLESV
jgi:hypothetical protein